jgi:hypothetical protein
MSGSNGNTVKHMHQVVVHHKIETGDRINGFLLMCWGLALLYILLTQVCK